METYKGIDITEYPNRSLKYKAKLPSGGVVWTEKLPAMHTYIDKELNTWNTKGM